MPGSSARACAPAASKRVDLRAKEGERRVEGAVFVDATGDGDLAAAAGCPCSVGRPSDGLTQAMTMSFRMAGVDKSEMQKRSTSREARTLVEPYFADARARGRLDFPFRDFVHFYDYPRPGVLHFNMTRINPANGLVSADLTRAEIEGRRQAFVLADWLVREVPCFRGAWLEKVACHVGVRETRHVDCAYTMSHEDIAAGRKFKDGIARSCYFIDIHSPTGSGFDHEKTGTRGEYKETLCAAERRLVRGALPVAAAPRRREPARPLPGPGRDARGVRGDPRHGHDDGHR